MIEGVKFVRYRGFENFQVKLSPSAVLVGANSAGKSTIVEALALAEQCARTARRKNPTIRVNDLGKAVKAFALPRPEVEGVDPVYYDFSREGTRVTVTWASEGRLHIVWPEDDEYGSQDGFFWFENSDGWQPRLNTMAELFPPLTIIPVVTPLDHVEDLKNADYVKKMVGTRLSSRHFRNHLYMMTKSGTLNEFLEFSAAWIPEIEVREVVLDAAADRLGVFYGEKRSRVPKELAWAGDGMQIWLQLLWHVYRAAEANTIVLDEPEVYLHPDLQRRLVRLLDECDAQIILATHSSEVVTEAAPESVVWIDRSARKGNRVTAPSKLAGVADGLGTNYNLALVRATRSKMVIAAEDSRLLRLLGRSVGARAISTEDNVSLIPIRSFSTWAGSEPLAWIAKDVLVGVSSFAVLLNSDCRPSQFDDRILEELSEAGIYCRIWPWREILNCLLTPSILGRASGADPAVMAHHLTDAVDLALPEARLKIDQQGLRFAERHVGNGESSASAADRILDTELGRVRSVYPATVLEHLNGWLVPGGYRALTPTSVAKAAGTKDLPLELVTVLMDLELRA